jgi:mannose-6-phosphate isomerase-like protein (cupin superfamily)
MVNRITVQKALEAISDSDDGLYGVLLENGSMELGYYKPVGRDDQKPHEQDEIYIVQTGNGTFVRDGEEIVFGPGDALFVAAGVSHRFVDFSDDFAAWVIFWGPTGGES